MRSLLLVLLAACSHPPPARWTPPPTVNDIVIDGDSIIRPESDGGASVITRVTLDDKLGFGAVRVPGDPTTVKASPILAVAQARAWQALSIAMAATPERAYEAARHGMTALPACTDGPPPHIPELTKGDPQRSLDEVFAIRAELVHRLACFHRSPSQGADHVVIDSDLIVRREPDGAIGVIAFATFGGVTGAGYMRLLRTPFEKASSSSFVDLARMRAWQVVMRLLADKPETAYEAGLKAEDILLGCGGVDHNRVRLHAEQRHADPNGLADAVAILRDMLDDQVVGCMRRYHGSAL